MLQGSYIVSDGFGNFPGNRAGQATQIAGWAASLRQSMSATKRLSTNSLLLALSHPLRRQILRELDREISSPNKLAALLSEPIPNVSYHVKILKERGAVRLVKRKPVRGTVEHFYGSQVAADWAQEVLMASESEDQIRGR
jgi:DNA-binding transcriptional ArsR family regulator